MAQFCTCGAQLPPDALFCHKCGKPQRETGAPENQTTSEFPELLPPPRPLRETPPLSFQNPVALRVALTVAAAATILSFIAPFINWLAGGFFAVLFYRRRTGTLLNVHAGLRLGWITGIMAFVFSAIVFAIQVLPHLRSTIEKQLSTALPERELQQMMHLVDSGPGIAMLVFFMLAAMFVLITFLTMAGGAIGAKMMGRS